jgi:hypothetical protein
MSTDDKNPRLGASRVSAALLPSAPRSHLSNSVQFENLWPLQNFKKQRLRAFGVHAER